MLYLNKKLAALSLLASSTAFAGTMGATCSEINASIPCKDAAWSVGAQALYLQTSTAASNLTGTHIQALSSNSYDGFNPPYNWGFKVDTGYQFNTGNDINLNWYNLQESFIHNGAHSVTQIDSNNWNAVNLELGQKLKFGELKYIRLHGGVSYSRISVHSRTYATGSLGGVPAPQEANVSSTYNGFGPRIGADMVYGWSNGLGVYANGATTLLIGSERFDNIISLGSTTTLHGGSTSVVVPALEAKLGATYTYQIASGKLNLDAGWMWVNYFHAFFEDRSTLSIVGYQATSSNDFALQGPFVGVKWTGNVV